MTTERRRRQNREAKRRSRAKKKRNAQQTLQQQQRQRQHGAPPSHASRLSLEQEQPRPRDIHCSQCDEVGHNKRTCPSLKPEQQEQQDFNPDTFLYDWEKMVRALRAWQPLPSPLSHLLSLTRSF